MKRSTQTIRPFIPRVGTDAESRISSLEEHLYELTAELEYVLSEIHAAMGRLETAQRDAGTVRAGGGGDRV